MARPLPRHDLETMRTRDGVRIAYRRAGRTDPSRGPLRILLIHSLALDHSVWDEVIDRMDGAAELIALDCRGHGRSDMAPGPYTVELFADDVADLLAHAGWDRAIVAGCSMGGCVAQAVAARHAGAVEALLLVDTTAWYGADAPTAWRERAAKARADGLAGMAGFQTTRWFGDRFRETHQARMRGIMEIFAANDLDAYAATCAMLGDADLRGHLAGIRCPTAIIVGEEDYATPPAAAERLRQAIPGAALTIIPEARHLTPIERPDVIGDHLLALAGRRAGSMATH
jgi:3-oxoadipate enol-lactonase